eukprot:7254077-Prorocentrum_lima.AAC.1
MENSTPSDQDEFIQELIARSRSQTPTMRPLRSPAMSASRSPRGMEVIPLSMAQGWEPKVQPVESVLNHPVKVCQ